VNGSKKPEGCYTFDGSLWLSRNPANRGQGTIGLRKPLCSDRSSPMKEPCRRRPRALPKTTTSTSAVQAQTTTSTTQTTTTTAATTATSTASTTTTATAPPQTAPPNRTTAPPSGTMAAPPEGTAKAASADEAADGLGSLPSLLCFSVGSASGLDAELLRVQFRSRAGVFVCDKYLALTEGGTVALGQGSDTTSIPSGPESGSGEDRTQRFVKAWSAVVHEGGFRLHDWTVRVDLHTVFFPERLRRRLRGMSSAEGLFFSNCARGGAGRPRLLEAVEVLSRAAVSAYAASAGECLQLLRAGWPEGRFLQACLRRLEVGEVFDGAMVADRHCGPAPCTDTSRIAFSAREDLAEYMACFAAAKDAGMLAS